MFNITDFNQRNFLFQNLSCSVLDTLNFVESGEGIYVSLPTKLQRLLVSKADIEATDSVDCNPQSYVPHHGPVAAGLKIGFKNKTTLHGSIDRDAWCKYSLFTLIMTSKLGSDDFICNIVYSLMS